MLLQSECSCQNRVYEWNGIGDGEEEVEAAEEESCSLRRSAVRATEGNPTVCLLCLILFCKGGAGGAIRLRTELEGSC